MRSRSALKRLRVISLCFVLLHVTGSATSRGLAQSVDAAKAGAGWAIAIHGGAGAGEWEHMTPATERAYHEGLARALEAGGAVLRRGGASLDAVEAALQVLEDDPLFNAGRGAAFDEQGRNEMDAAIMNGATLAAGSVASVRATKHPISLARAVMEKTPYVMMVGPGADAFSIRAGLEQEPPKYFWTAGRWLELEDVLRKSGRPVPPLPEGVSAADLRADADAVSSADLQGDAGVKMGGAGRVSVAHRFGTTGAVARDSAGHVAAGTSTGGLQGKMMGRVGDSPVIGAGTYANDRTCAVSGTGVGEYFIRLNLARRVCDLVEFRGMTVQAAADTVIQQELPALKGGEGGVIVLRGAGEPVWSFNTLGMFRARAVEGGAAEIEVRSAKAAGGAGH